MLVSFEVDNIEDISDLRIGKHTSCGNSPYLTLDRFVGVTCGGSQYESVGILVENSGCGASGYHLEPFHNYCGNHVEQVYPVGCGRSYCGQNVYSSSCGGCRC